MRIAAIAAVFVVVIAFGIYMTGGRSSAPSYQGQAAESGHAQVASSAGAVLESQAQGEGETSGVVDHQEHAKEMVHGMAAQHAMHEQAKKDHDKAGSHAVHWGYEGAGAPENWGKLSSDYAICGTGRNQSPVDLSGFIDAELPGLDFGYSGMAIDILNNGHTVQANYQPGTTLMLDGRPFELKQFHFHAPSENTINGVSFPLEAHLVHADSDGNLAVVSVLYRQGKTNGAISKLWAQMPENPGDKNLVAAQVKAGELLPRDTDYYRFNGSLTTPPCSQGVIWLVMKKQPEVSKDQIAYFSKVMGGPNNRPVQPLNARVVLE